MPKQGDDIGAEGEEQVRQPPGCDRADDEVRDILVACGKAGGKAGLTRPSRERALILSLSQGKQMSVGPSFDPILPAGGLSAAPDVRRNAAIAAAYVLLGALTLSPLLWAGVPPLVDYPDHLARSAGACPPAWP